MQARELRPRAGPTRTLAWATSRRRLGTASPWPWRRPSGGPGGLPGRPALPRPLSVKWAQQCASQPPALPAGQKASCPPPTRPCEDSLTALCVPLLSDSVRCPATREVGEAMARAPVNQESSGRPPSAWAAAAAVTPGRAPTGAIPPGDEGPSSPVLSKPVLAPGATGLERLSTLLLGKFPSSFLHASSFSKEASLARPLTYRLREAGSRRAGTEVQGPGPPL